MILVVQNGNVIAQYNNNVNIDYTQFPNVLPGDVFQWDVPLAVPNPPAIPDPRLPSDRLTAFQTAANSSIDSKTAALLVAGFEFTTAAGDGPHPFSLDIASQVIWIGLLQSSALLTYPQPVGSADNHTVELASADEVASFYRAGMIRFQTIVQTAIQLKTAIKNATTPEQVLGVVAGDNRT